MDSDTETRPKPRSAIAAETKERIAARKAAARAVTLALVNAPLSPPADLDAILANPRLSGQQLAAIAARRGITPELVLDWIAGHARPDADALGTPAAVRLDAAKTLLAIIGKPEPKAVADMPTFNLTLIMPEKGASDPQARTITVRAESASEPAQLPPLQPVPAETGSQPIGKDARSVPQEGPSIPPEKPAAAVPDSQSLICPAPVTAPKADPEAKPAIPTVHYATLPLGLDNVGHDTCTRDHQPGPLPTIPARTANPTPPPLTGGSGDWRTAKAGPGDAKGGQPSFGSHPAAPAPEPLSSSPIHIRWSCL